MVLVGTRQDRDWFSVDVLDHVDAICKNFKNERVSFGQTLCSSVGNDANTSFERYLPPINEHCIFLHPTGDFEVSIYLEILKKPSRDTTELAAKS